jgi:hypothetical protein
MYLQLAALESLVSDTRSIGWGMPFASDGKGGTKLFSGRNAYVWRRHKRMQLIKAVL